MFLTPEELYALTDYQAPAWQIKWLQARGWKYELGASGRPKVSRTYAQQRMGAYVAEVQPDFSFLTKAA